MKKWNNLKLGANNWFALAQRIIRRGINLCYLVKLSSNLDNSITIHDRRISPFKFENSIFCRKQQRISGLLFYTHPSLVARSYYSLPAADVYYKSLDAIVYKDRNPKGKFKKIPSAKGIVTIIITIPGLLRPEDFTNWFGHQQRSMEEHAVFLSHLDKENFYNIHLVARKGKHNITFDYVRRYLNKEVLTADFENFFNWIKNSTESFLEYEHKKYNKIGWKKPEFIKIVFEPIKQSSQYLQDNSMKVLDSSRDHTRQKDQKDIVAIQVEQKVVLNPNSETGVRVKSFEEVNKNYKELVIGCSIIISNTNQLLANYLNSKCFIKYNIPFKTLDPIDKISNRKLIKLSKKKEKKLGVLSEKINNPMYSFSINNIEKLRFSTSPCDSSYYSHLHNFIINSTSNKIVFNQEGESILLSSLGFYFDICKAKVYTADPERKILYSLEYDDGRSFKYSVLEKQKSKLFNQLLYILQNYRSLIQENISLPPIENLPFMPYSSIAANKKQRVGGLLNSTLSRSQQTISNRLFSTLLSYTTHDRNIHKRHMYNAYLSTKSSSLHIDVMRELDQLFKFKLNIIFKYVQKIGVYIIKYCNPEVTLKFKNKESTVAIFISSEKLLHNESNIHYSTSVLEEEMWQVFTTNLENNQLYEVNLLAGIGKNNLNINYCFGEQSSISRPLINKAKKSPKIYITKEELSYLYNFRKHWENVFKAVTNFDKLYSKTIYHKDQNYKKAWYFIKINLEPVEYISKESEGNDMYKFLSSTVTYSSIILNDFRDYVEDPKNKELHKNNNLSIKANHNTLFLKIAIQNFIKAVINDKLTGVIFPNYNSISEFVLNFDPSFKISKQSLSNLKRRKLVFKRLIINKDVVSFFYYIHGIFPLFDLRQFLSLIFNKNP